MITSENEACQVIAQSIVNVADNSWAELRAECPILGSGCGGVVTIQKSQSGEVKDLPIGLSVFDIQDACLFLRKHFYELTGNRIWGLTFTLYPTGKFNIEYDYNKPADYEETDDVIAGDEINQSLSRLS